MNLPEEIFIFHDPEEYKIEGAKIKIFYEEKKKNWGFVIKNIYTPLEIKEWIFNQEPPPCFGIIYGESHLDFKTYLLIRNYISEKKIVLIGPKSPAFLSPNFSFKKSKYNTDKKGNILLVTRSEETLNYSLKYLSKEGFRVRYAVSLGESLFPFLDFFDILSFFIAFDEIELIVCVNETGTFLNLPSYHINKPLIFLMGGAFLFEEETEFKEYLNTLGIILPEKSIYELVKRGINVVYHWKDMIEILKVYEKS